jgi:hypothetical protein
MENSGRGVEYKVRFNAGIKYKRFTSHGNHTACPCDGVKRYSENYHDENVGTWGRLICGENDGMKSGNGDGSALVIEVDVLAHLGLLGLGNRRCTNDWRHEDFVISHCEGRECFRGVVLVLRHMSVTEVDVRVFAIVLGHDMLFEAPLCMELCMERERG